MNVHLIIHGQASHPGAGCAGRRGQEFAVQGKCSADIRAFLDSILSGIVIIDIPTRTVRFANAFALSVLQASQEEVVGRTCTDMLCPNLPDDCPILDRGLNVDRGRCVIQTKAGEDIPVQKTVTYVEFEGDTCLMESFTDLSETLKLETLKEDLERITRHDLKTPLVQIINLADLLLLDHDLQSEHRAYAGLIQRSGRRMMRIINATLDLYKLEAGTYCLFPESIRLVGVIRDIVSDLLPQVRGAQVRFALNFDEGVYVWGEDALVYCVLSNLIKNAVEASPPDGTVSITVRRGREATVAIHNQLPVPAAIRETFLEKYVTSGKPHGTGLGIYSALLSAKAMRGSISFTSSEQEGTTVTVTLPLAPEDAAARYENEALAD